jgi:hypothetical protein
MDARVVSKAILPKSTGAECPASGCRLSLRSSIVDSAVLCFAGRTLAGKQMHLRTDDENSRPIRVEADDTVSFELFDAELAERAKRLELRGIGFRSGATGECAREIGAAHSAAALLGGAEEIRLCVDLV